MDRERLEAQLEATFGGQETTLRAVSRQAQDLADSGRIAADLGSDLTVEQVVDALEDAPAEHSVVERWNWWLGSLSLSHGGYHRFRVRPDLAEP